MAKTKLSHRDIRSRLSAALEAANPGVYTYVSDVWPDPAEVVYSVESPNSPRQMLRTTWSIDGDKVTLGTPEKVVEVTSYETVEFAAFSVGNDTVKYRGKIFELGDYPDKEFSLNDVEADADIATQRPVSIDSEHRKSLFDGKLGNLTKRWREGTGLFGEMEAPRALYNLLGDNITVSCHWNPVTKTLHKLALAADPRITDASLTAAFSKAEEPRNGGVVSSFIHGLLSKFSNEDKAELKKALDTQPGTQTVDPATTAELERLRNENAQFKATQATGDASRIGTAAAAFADRVIKTDRRAFPSEREFIESWFSDSLQADNAGKACFSANGEPAKGERMDRLEKYFANRPKLDYDEDKLKEAQIVFSVSGKPEAAESSGASAAQEIYAELNKPRGGA